MIITRNTNSAGYDVYPYIVANGVEESSRNGPVLAVPHPVTICYEHPEENVNFCPIRDANPFFHFMEMLWMLEGVGDVKLIANYLPRMAEFSDDGRGFNAHYGFNIRYLFGRDQLPLVVKELMGNPDTRRAVVQIWNPDDLNKNSKDIGCNLQLLFRQVDGRLNMTVYNRSNDAIWGGVTGANITNLFIFQAWISAATGIPIGKQYVVSNNLHIYLDNPKTQSLLDKYVRYPIKENTAYYPGDPWKLVAPGETMQQVDLDISRFLIFLRRYNFNPARYVPATEFLDLAYGIAKVHYHYKNKEIYKAIHEAKRIASEDWATASVRWLNRRVRL